MITLRQTTTLLTLLIVSLLMAGCPSQPRPHRYCYANHVEEDGGYFYERDGGYFFERDGGYFFERDGGYFYERDGGFFYERDGVSYALVCRSGVRVDEDAL